MSNKQVVKVEFEIEGPTAKAFTAEVIVGALRDSVTAHAKDWDALFGAIGRNTRMKVYGTHLRPGELEFFRRFIKAVFDSAVVVTDGGDEVKPSKRSRKVKSEE